MHKKHTVLFYCETIEVCDMSSFWLVKHVCNYLAVVCRHKLPKSDKTYYKFEQLKSMVWPI